MTKAKTKTKTLAKIKTNPASAFFSEWEKQQKKQNAEARKTLRRACLQLAKLEVDIVTIKYDGYGDSGTLDDPVALQNGKPVELPRKLNELLLEFAESFLPGGWEINDGACGEFVLNIKDRKSACTSFLLVLCSIFFGHFPRSASLMLQQHRCSPTSQVLWTHLPASLHREASSTRAVGVHVSLSVRNVC